MTYQMMPLGCDPLRIKGMSKKSIVSHSENKYGAAVKRLNLILPPSAQRAASRSGARTGPSQAPTKAAIARPPSTRSSRSPSSPTSIHRLGSPTCSRACLTIQPSGSPNSCLGIGEGKILPPKQLDRSESRYPVAFTARAFRTVFGVPDRPLQQ
jgi:hypothetical protein